jgi:subtilisin family serine protease
VVGIAPDLKARADLTESLPLIHQPDAAAAGYTGAGTAVAVMDTGVDYTQPAFGSCTAPNTPAGCRVV